MNAFTMPPREELDQIRDRCRDENLDFHREVAAKGFNVPRENVTPPMRAFVKNALFGYLYTLPRDKK